MSKIVIHTFLNVSVRVVETSLRWQAFEQCGTYKKMKQAIILGILACLGVLLVNAEDPYRYYTWEVTYGTVSPLGFPQQVRHLSLLI